MEKAKCYFLAIFVLECLVMIKCTAIETTRTNIITDQSALLSLKAHITSDPLQLLSNNWSSTVASSVCDWIGVECGLRHYRVTALNISNMGLIGTIPPELGNLSFLVSLDISGNYFHGNLPEELSRLHRLRFLTLKLNNFSGQVPRCLGLLPKLQNLDLSNNSFTGSIPPSIFNLSNLEILSAQGNFLEGEIPEVFGNLHKLRYINLQDNQLRGPIPLSIFNISTLEVIGFSLNSLSGTLPKQICHRLPRLQGLHLPYNRLSGQIPSGLSQCLKLQTLALPYNNFGGEIPKEIGNLQLLEKLLVQSNNLQGVIPPEIGKLQNLKVISMQDNRLMGSIPKEVGNLTMVNLLSLSNNSLTGAIPEEMCNLQELEELYLRDNMLTGSIPLGIFNHSTLARIILGNNFLTGNLPSDVAYSLPSLEVIDISRNNLGGRIPASIANSSKLSFIGFATNQITGSVPSSLGDLRFLKILSLQQNKLTSDPSSSELAFITSLTKCRNLTHLLLHQNPLFHGVLPVSIGNLSSSLAFFFASSCNIKGTVPGTIGNLSSLIELNLRDNQLTGVIPTEVEDLQKLQVLSFSINKLSGALEGFCNMKSLSELYLHINRISGPIPACYGNMTNLRRLELGNNLLVSSPPITFWNLKDLLQLNLSSNSLTGSLPREMGNLKAALSVDVSMNQFSGDIPGTVGDLQNLLYLSLAYNNFTGSIPESFSNMLSLDSLDLSHNSFSGLIPKSLEALQSLRFFNVSFNHLNGEIPSKGPFRNFTGESFKFNDEMCGDAKFQVPQCQTNSPHSSRGRKVILAAFIALGTVVAVASAFIYTRYRKKHVVQRGNDPIALPTQERVSYFELQQATNGFDESNLLGSGSFGSVYRGILNDGRLVAVKLFNLEQEGAVKSFDVECEVFRKLRHRNLVKVISSCSNQEFKALVLEYMGNGSLEKWLYSHNYFLDITQRLNIMIDVASALHYLHHECPTSVIHCDLKPSNILLDEELSARLSDFGIAKLLGMENSVALTKTIATIGYIAPEYGNEGLISAKCDVYSYGIMLMEVFTRKRPTDETFGESLNLKGWVNALMPTEILQVIDTNLLKPNDGLYTVKFKGLSSIMELALSCVSESPKERPCLTDVLGTLRKIKLSMF